MKRLHSLSPITPFFLVSLALPSTAFAQGNDQLVGSPPPSDSAPATDTTTVEEPAEPTTVEPEPVTTPAPTKPATDKSKTYDEFVALAQTSFEAKDYGTAYRALEKAYSIDPNPNLLYNMARIKEAQGDLQGALELYEEFVVAPDIDIEYRRETLDRIQVLEKTIEVTQKKKRDDAAEPEEEVALPQPTQLPPPSTTAPKPMRRVGAVMMGAGGVALISGGIFGALALSEHQRWRNETDLEDARDTAKRVDRFSLVADGLYLAGGVTAAVGLTLFIAGRSEQEDAAVTVAPVITREGAGGALRVRF